MRIENKIAVITGGASGMGRSTAEIFAREGAKVVVTDMLETEGQAVAAAIEASGGTARFVPLDVSDEAAWQRVVDATVAEFGRIDILVNSAGISGSGYADVTDSDAWNKLMTVNATGTFLGIKFVAPVMEKAGGGSIINVSSISGNVGHGFIHFGYNASKGAIRTLTKTAADRYGSIPIRVNSVHPGLMPPMRTSGATADPKVRAKMLEHVPLGRSGRVEEVGYAILFLASDEASYITGVELPVDGGYLAV